MPASIDELKSCASAADVKRGLRLLCADFGCMARLDVLMVRRGGVRQAMCFWRMESRSQDEAVMNHFGIGCFGGDLVLVVELQAEQAPVPTALPAVPVYSSAVEKYGSNRLAALSIRA